MVFAEKSGDFYFAGDAHTPKECSIYNKKLFIEEAFRLTFGPHVLAPIKLGIKVADFFLQLVD